MEEREENHQERLEKQFSKLEEEWTAMKTGKTSAVSWLTVEEAALIELVENCPRNLKLSLHNNREPEEMIDQISSPSFRRKLFHDSSSDYDDADDYKTKTSSLSLSSCCSSNGKRVRDNNNKMTKKCRRIVFVTMLLLLSWLLVNGFDHFFGTTKINTLIPT